MATKIQQKEITAYPKILVVDDSEFSRRNIVRFLEEENFQVVGEAASAKEAGEFLGHNEINIAIIDIVMPEISGIELANHIKDNFQKTIHLIMISSLGLEHIVLEALTAGAADFLHKPFSKNELITSTLKIAEIIKEDESI